MQVNPIGAMTPPVRSDAAVAAAAAAAPGVPAALSEADVGRVVAAANRALQQAGSGLQFSVDQNTGKTIVRVVDSETKQVIRQIPSEEMLELSRAIDTMQVKLLEQTA